MGRAEDIAGLLARRHGPWGLPAVWGRKVSADVPLAQVRNRALPRFHCFQIMARNL